MIKENVLRKNLLTNKIDYGNVDSEFELQNLKGNIIDIHPYIEITNIKEIEAYELINLKASIKDKLLSDYKKSKTGIVFKYENQTIKFENDLEEAIKELINRKASETLIGLEFLSSLEVLDLLLNKIITKRHEIRSNVDKEQNKVENIKILKKIQEYQPSLEIEFAKEIEVLEFLK